MTFVEMARLRTSPAPLRGERSGRSDLAPLPIRVAPNPDGTFEALDRFKRLAAWRAEQKRLGDENSPHAARIGWSFQ